MALLDSKQLNPRLTGSFTLSGSMIGNSSSTGSFGELNVFGNSNIDGTLTIGGDIQEFIDELQMAENAEKLKEGTSSDE